MVPGFDISVETDTKLGQCVYGYYGYVKIFLGRLTVTEPVFDALLELITSKFVRSLYCGSKVLEYLKTLSDPY